MFFLPEEITTVFTVQLRQVFQGQDVTIFALQPSDSISLFIKINKPPIPQYRGEKSMFGKTIRLLDYLQKESRFIQLLQLYNIEQVCITETPDARLVSNKNTTTLNTNFIVEVFENQSVLRSAGLEEEGLRLLIAENINY